VGCVGWASIGLQSNCLWWCFFPSCCSTFTCEHQTGFSYYVPYT
jgi:hypothetical protein